MDVHCANCGEPWDTYHLRHDLIHDTRDDILIQAGLSQLTPAARAALRELGWEFGSTVLNVRHCECCPKGSAPKQDPMRDGLEQMLGSDHDGLESEMSDLGL